jgi:peptide/nickel transport system substrate-binding protein
MHKTVGAIILVAGLAVAATAEAQTLNVMRAIDAPHFDAQRTTWAPTADIVNMIQDTLLALDWDGKTPIPYLARSWDISPDGKTYTFHLRDDVTFCSGKKFTAEDVVYSFQRLKDPATKAPYAWRAGDIKEVRAADPYTVVYELKEPYSELLLQLTMFTNVIHNRESVEKLGKDYGVANVDGTGPWCFVSWQPRTEIVLKRHDAYHWGPAMYQNPGPVKFEKLVIRIVPEDSSRMAAMMSGQFDFTNAFPVQFLAQAKAAPMLQVQEVKPSLLLAYYGFKTTRDLVSDRRVREAMSIAIDRAEIAKGSLFGVSGPAFTYVNPDALDFAPATKGIIKEDVERAKRLLDEAGWKPGADGIREKDGIKLAPRVYYTSVGGMYTRAQEAMQGYMRKIGIDWRLQPWDSTIAAAKMAEQDYEIWTVTVPYLSAGDLMSLYFDSRNIPTPNRMNWKDEQTDELLARAKAALTDEERARNYMLVQERVMAEHLWIPVENVSFYTVTNKRLKGVRPHMLYGNAFYKGLDLSF